MTEDELRKYVGREVWYAALVVARRLRITPKEAIWVYTDAVAKQRHLTAMKDWKS